MTTIPPLLHAHMQQQVTTLAYCWKLTLKTGEVFAFTAHDQPIIYDGVTYIPASSTIGETIETLEETNSPFTVEASITSSELDALWKDDSDLNGATVMWLVLNYMDVSQGHAILKEGEVVSVHHQGNRTYLNCQGPLHKLERTIGELYSPSCRAQLGDSKCQVDVESYRYIGAVTETLSDHQFKDSNCQYDPQYYTYGTITFITGNNHSVAYQVKSYYQGVFSLLVPTRYPIAFGDQFTAIPGCNKAFATCIAKFNNALNFRGEPHVPGENGLIKIYN